MKSLFLMVAMVALMVSAQTVLAGDSSYMGFLKEWHAQQAKERKIDTSLDQLGKQGPVAFRGTTARAGKAVRAWGTAAGKGSDK